MPKKILVIDDEELLTKTFVSLLEKKGYEVMVATKGQDAIEMFGEEDFDLILSDIRMPGLSGVETIKRIYALPGSSEKKPKVIFITGFADTVSEMEAQRLKPVAYIEKPFNVETLLQAIKKALG